MNCFWMMLRLPLLLLVYSLAAGDASAQKSAHFNGLYRVILPDRLAGQDFLFHGSSRLANIWSLYGEPGAPLPNSWVPHRDSAAFIAALDDRSFVLVALEGTGLFGPGYLKCGQALEMDLGSRRAAWPKLFYAEIITYQPGRPIGLRRSAKAPYLGTATVIGAPYECYFRLPLEGDTIQRNILGK